jgi:phosphate-selective porin OprO/OprP
MLNLASFSVFLANHVKARAVKPALMAVILAFWFSSPLAAQHMRFVWGAHPSLRAGDWLRIDFRARFQRDVRRSAALPDVDVNKEADTLDIARRRVGIEGKFADMFDYQVEYELGTEERPWRDVYLNWGRFDAFQIRAGKFKLPFSVDENTSSTGLDFIYRSRMASRLAPGRERGLMVHGSVANDVIGYQAGVFQHDGDNGRPSSTSARVFGGRTTVARVILRPFRIPKSTIDDFQIGVAFSGTTVPEGFPTLRGRTALGTKFFDSDLWVNGRRLRTGFEARWRPGPFSIQSEYIRVTDERNGQSIEDTDLSSFLAQGWYVSGSFALTGERKSDGLDEPKRPFLQGGLGAIELAARLEKLSFGSTAGTGEVSTSPRADAVLGNSDSAVTFGVNWYLNRWVKIQANLIRERLEDPSRGPLPSQAGFWSRVLRLQLSI